MSVEIKVTADTRKASEDIDRLRGLLKKVQDEATKGSKKTKIIDVNEDQLKILQLNKTIQDLNAKLQKMPKHKVFDSRSLNDAISQTQQINNNVNRINTSAVKLGNTFKSVFALGAVTLFGNSILRTAQTFEGLRTRLNVATGSLNKAQRAFSDIQTFAAQTKFSVDALTDSYARLANTGSDLLSTNGDILNGIEAIANAVTAVGGGDYEIQRVAEAFARMAAEGRVTYERLEPLTTAGISLQKVAAAAGKSWNQWSDKMAQGNLTFEEVYAAFNKLAMSTQGFGGIARKQTNSLSGAFSNLGDAIKGFQDSVINSTGIKDVIIAVTNSITSSINTLTRFVRNDLTVAITQFKRFVLELQIGFLKSRNVIQDFVATVTKFDFTSWIPDFSKYRLDLGDYLPDLAKVQKTVYNFGKFVKKVFYDVWDAVVGNSYWPDTIKGIADWSNQLYALAAPGVNRFSNYMSDVFLDIRDAFDMWKEKINIEVQVIKDVGALAYIQNFFSSIVKTIKDVASSGIDSFANAIDRALVKMGNAIKSFAEYAKTVDATIFFDMIEVISRFMKMLAPNLGELTGLSAKLQKAFAKFDIPNFEIKLGKFRIDVSETIRKFSLDYIKENFIEIMEDAVAVFRNGIADTKVFQSIFTSIGETFGRIITRALTDDLKTTFAQDIQDIVIAAFLVAFNSGFRQIALATLVFKIAFGDDASFTDGLLKLKKIITDFGNSILQGLGLEGFAPSSGGFIVGLLFGTAALAIASGKMTSLIGVVAKELINFFILSKIFGGPQQQQAAPAAQSAGGFLGKAFKVGFTAFAGIAALFVGLHIGDAIAESLDVENTFYHLGITAGAVFLSGWAITAGAGVFGTWISTVVGPAIILGLKRLAIAAVFSASMFPAGAAIISAITGIVATIAAFFTLPVLLGALGIAAGSSLIYYALFGDKDAKGIEGKVTRFSLWLKDSIKSMIVGTYDLFVDIFKGIGNILVSTFDSLRNTVKDLKNFLFEGSFKQPTQQVNPQQRRANGGRISGPGTGRSDSILARLSNGEFVVNAKATAQNLPLLRSINSGMPAFQNGGLVDYSFIRQMENGTDSTPKTKGYIPTNKKGMPIDSSGVTIASGLDLGSKDVAWLKDLGLPDNLIDRFKPYLGKKRVAAQIALKRKPLYITSAEADLIDSKVIPLFAKGAAREYTGLSARDSKISFEQLPQEVRTALTSARYQYGSLTARGWLAEATHLASLGHYDKAAEKFETSGDKYASRRKAEANLIKTAAIKSKPPILAAVPESRRSTLDDILDLFRSSDLNVAPSVAEANEKALEDAINQNNDDPKTKKRIARTLIGRLLGLPSYADGTEDPINFIKTPTIEDAGLNIGKFNGASFIKNETFSKQLTTDEKLLLGSKEMRRELTRHLTENIKNNISTYFPTDNDSVLTTSDAVTKGALEGVNLDLFGGKLKGRIKKDGFKVLFTKQFANGGKISGPGNGRSDSILARLSNGEFVVNAKATAQNLPLLQSINKGMPGFANGTQSPIGNAVSQINPAQSRQKLKVKGKEFNIDLEEFFNTLLKLKVENKDLAENSEELAISFKKSLDTIDNWTIRLALNTVSIKELSENIKPLSGDLGKLATDVKTARLQGKNQQFKTNGAGDIDPETFARIKNLLVQGLGADPSKNALFDQELKLNLLKNLDVLSTLNSLQAQITAALASTENTTPDGKKFVDNFIAGVTDRIRERLNEIAPSESGTRSPRGFIQPASAEAGRNASQAFVGDFKSGLAETLKGTKTGKEFGEFVVNSFTSKVVDSFASRLTDTVFSGDFFAKIFGGTAQIGEGTGGLLNFLLPSSAPAQQDLNKPDNLLDVLSVKPKAPIPVVVVPGTDSVFKSVSGGSSGGGLFGGLGDTFGKIKDGFGDFFSKGFSGISSLFSFLPGFASGGVIPGQMGSATPVLAHAGEIILNESQQSRVAAAMSNSNQQVVNVNITGDISRQTKSEIYRMLPSIAEGVNSHNREKGLR